MPFTGRFDFGYVDLVEFCSTEFAESLREFVDDPDFACLFVPVRGAASMMGMSDSHVHHLLRSRPGRIRWARLSDRRLVLLRSDVECLRGARAVLAGFHNPLSSRIRQDRAAMASIAWSEGGAA